MADSIKNREVGASTESLAIIQKSRRPTGVTGKVSSVLSVLLCLLIVTFVLDIPTYFNVRFSSATFVSTAMGLILALTYLLVPARKRRQGGRPPWYDIVLLFMAVVPCLYFATNFTSFSNIYSRAGLIGGLHELIMGILLTISVLEGTRRTVGWPLVIIALVFIGYTLTGSHFPGFLQTKSFTVERLIGYLFTSVEGIFFFGTRITVTIVAMFVLFAAFLQVVGGAQFFLDLANALVGQVRGGPAKIAVVASSFFGTLSGSPTANVAGTGTFTIPMMKNIGYKPQFAGAVEASASTGGQIMPPVMGATAFVMADMLAMPYIDICGAALLPAVLYYLTIFLSVDFEAAKSGLRGLPPESKKPLLKVLVQGGLLFVTPIAVLLYFMIFAHYLPEKAVFFALIAFVIIGVFRKETRIGLKSAIGAGAEAGSTMVAIGSAIGAAGIVIACVALTGVGLTLATGLVALSGGNLSVLLILTAVVCLILGMGLETIICYILLVTLVGPALAQLGVVPIAAHLFVFYFGMMAFVTPPVCVAVYVAATIASSQIWSTGWIAMRLAMVGLIVPFAFIYNPAYVMVGSLWDITWAWITGIIGFSCLTVGIWGYLRSRIGLITRIVFLLAGAATLASIFQVQLAGMGLGIAGLIMSRVWGQEPAVRLAPSSPANPKESR